MMQADPKLFFFFFLTLIKSAFTNNYARYILVKHL